MNVEKITSRILPPPAPWLLRMTTISIPVPELLAPSNTILDDASFIIPDPNTNLEGKHLIRFFDTNRYPTTEPDDEWVDEEPVTEDPVDEITDPPNVSVPPDEVPY